MRLYQNGILRVAITEDESKRFKLSDIGIGVEEKQLQLVKPLEDFVSIQNDKLIIQAVSEDTEDRYEYTVQFSPFRIEQRVNLQLTLVANYKDTLFFENSQFYHSQGSIDQASIQQDCFNQVINSLGTKERYFKLEKYQTGSDDFKEGAGIGFFTASKHLFGLPERSDTFLLRNTDKTDPYRLFNVDVYPHDAYAQEGLYSSLPYVIGHSADHDQSIMYLNAAETWVDIFDWKYDESNSGRLFDFMTESGVIEFFMMASASQDAPKKVQKSLATITGFQYLPPLFSLGFHYSKWEATTSASKIMDYNNKFESNKFPLDVLWMDIPYTEDNKYFIFSSYKFPKDKLEEMKTQIDQSNRRMVVITDPHIKQDYGYKTFKTGLDKNKKTDSGKYVNIYVESNKGDVFYGYCWPGTSAYVDYFNEGAREFWKEQYSYNNFVGTNELFNIWIDMNEPSVFNGPEQTLPKDSHHYLSDGTQILHKDVHNSYGRMMIQATFEGLIARQTPAIRPFILTRSVFFGSQKYGAKWTGDNQSTFQELQVSIPMLLSLGISGVQFVGADIPGFAGNPSDELYCLFYQLGMFYPFFRGHGHIDYSNREPYLQKQDVQEVVRKTLFLRYELIHYIYTHFYIASTEGLPILRPMWYEFPQNERTFALEQQFMFGNSILVAPKLQSSSNSYFLAKTDYHVSFYLPNESNWYYYYSKTLEPLNGQVSKIIPKLEYGIFVKAGRILPLKIHSEKLSLLRIINNPIRLEIYLDRTNSAQGELYLDDGETFKHELQEERTFLEFNFSSNILKSKALLRNSYYYMASEILIEEVAIFGLQNEPKEMLDLNNKKKQEKNTFEFSYDNTREALYVKFMNIPIDDGDSLSGDDGKSLLQLIF